MRKHEPWQLPGNSTIPHRLSSEKNEIVGITERVDDTEKINCRFHCRVYRFKVETYALFYSSHEFFLVATVRCVLLDEYYFRASLHAIDERFEKLAGEHRNRCHSVARALEVFMNQKIHNRRDTLAKRQVEFSCVFSVLTLRKCWCIRLLEKESK